MISKKNTIKTYSAKSYKSKMGVFTSKRKILMPMLSFRRGVGVGSRRGGGISRSHGGLKSGMGGYGVKGGPGGGVG